MLVGLDIGENVDLVDSALLELLVLPELRDRNHLDGVLLLVLVVQGAIDFTIDSGAYFFV